MNPGLFKHKLSAGLSVGRRGGLLNTIDTLNHFFLNHEMIVVGSTYWNIGFGKMPKDVNSDKEALENMINLGENFSYILKKLNK